MTVAQQLEAIWQPGGSLPGGPCLRRMTGVLLDAWEAGHLAGDVHVGYNPRLRTTLGRALMRERCVELNPTLLRNHPSHLPATLAHELAHLVVFDRFGPIAPHGRAFRILMRQVGFSDSATHDLPVKRTRRRRRKYLYLHRCTECGGVFVDRRARRDWYCSACGPESSWDIFRLPDNDTGRRMIRRAKALTTAF